MKESYREDLASSSGLEPYAGDGNIASVASAHPLIRHQFEFLRLGHNRWAIAFDNRGRITQGASANTSFWWLENNDLIFANANGDPMYRLTKTEDNWQGHSLRHATLGVKLVAGEGSTLPELISPANIATESCAVEVADRFRNGQVADLVPGWWWHQIIREAHWHLAQEAIATTPPYPKELRGRGIVICAGGPRMFANA